MSIDGAARVLVLATAVLVGLVVWAFIFAPQIPPNYPGPTAYYECEPPLEDVLP